MKYFLFFLTTYVSLAFSQMYNYIPENKGNKAWISQKTCEKESGQKCYPFRPIIDDYDVMSVQEIPIDNPEKPIYAAAVDNRDCFLYEFDPENPMPENDCRVLIQRVNIGTEEEPEYVFPLCTDPTYYALYWETDPGVYEAYCTKHLGFESMLVKRLFLDEGLKAAKDAEIAAKLEDKTIEAKLQKLLLKYRDKIVWETIRDTETLSAKERSAVMKKISELQKK